MKERLSIKGLLVGVLLTWVLPLMSAIVFAPVSYVIWKRQGMSTDDMVARLGGTPILLLTLTIIVGCDFIGGYIAGRIAKKSQVVHGALVFILSALVGFTWHSFSPPTTATPSWWLGAWYILGILFAMWGGFVSKRLAEVDD